MTPTDTLARLREIIAAWPETREKLSHGAPTWWGGRKTFASFADNHHGDGRVAVWVKSSFLEQELRVEVDPETFFVPPYVGPSGWVGMRLDRDPDWEAVEQLLEEGYRMVAPKRAARGRVSACPLPTSPSLPTATLATPPDDYDSPWKEVSRRFFPHLVEFFAHDLYAIIDWSAGYEFLEQELRQMLRDAETGPRRVDKVVKVRTLSGKPLYLVLHVEIQVSKESGFSQRMFIYYYRLYDLYPEQVVSLAILADDEPDWEPKSYEHSLHGTEVEFGYRTVKIWEYNERWAELKKDHNPFALVVRAHLKTKATSGNAQKRLTWKVKLVRELYKRGYEREEVLELFRFIDWLLVLPVEMTQAFRHRIEEIEQESKMKYVTSIERLGRQEGRQEGLREVVLTQFEEKFGPPDAPIRRLLEQASQEQILLWARKILTASSQDEIFAT